MEIKIDGWKCERCGHVWPKTNGIIPRVCAKCHNPYWCTPRIRKARKKEE